MNKVFKSRIFAFVLGAILFGSIGVVSAYTIFANDIGYTPKDSTWKKSNGEDITNVKDAIDELYSKANEDNLVHLEVNPDTNYYTFTNNYKNIYMAAFRGPDVPVIKVNDVSQNYIARRLHSGYYMYIYKLENISKGDILYYAGFIDMFTIE